MHFLHGKEHFPIGVRSDVIYRHDIGMTQLAGDLGFPQKTESSGPFRLRQIGQLQRHRPTHFSVIHRNHHAAAALAQ